MSPNRPDCSHRNNFGGATTCKPLSPAPPNLPGTSAPLLIGLRTSTKYEFSLAKPQERVNNAEPGWGCIEQLVADGNRDVEVTGQARLDRGVNMPLRRLE